MKCGSVDGSYYWLAACNQSYVKYKHGYKLDVRHNIEKNKHHHSMYTKSTRGSCILIKSDAQELHHNVKTRDIGAIIADCCITRQASCLLKQQISDIDNP